MATQTGNSIAEDLQSRLSRIEQLLSTDPEQAEAQAGEVLAAVPGHPMAMLFQGIARRLAGRPEAAIDVLIPLCKQWPNAPLPHLQLGLALRESGQREPALQAMRRAVAIKPDFVDAWLALADLLTAMSDTKAADQAFSMYLGHVARDPHLLQPATALKENRTAEAETLLREHLARHPNDVAALCMLADVAARHSQLESAERLLLRCLELAPSYAIARQNYVVVLMRQSRPAEALRETDRLLTAEPKNSAFHNLRAAALINLGEYQQAIEVYEGLLASHPQQPRVWASLGHSLRTVGRRDQSVEAYRRAISLAPGFGEAYWNLANLKTFQVTDPELDAMQAQLEISEPGSEDRIHLHFAVGKALEDRAEYAESFRHYAEGNHLRRQSIQYKPEDVSDHVRCSKEVFTPEFLAARHEFGEDAPDPIFIVGLPRAGSTLVEQILASHSMVEGTMELAHIGLITKTLVQRAAADTGKAEYPRALLTIEAEECREFGRTYMDQTRILRRQGTPFFIDKMPNNFAHLGLIHLILPKARIIDVRRHPLACGLSLFKHLFARGQHFSYELREIGRFYSDYAELMAHFDAVLPGRVHRLTYERLVENPEAEVRRLLEVCGLPWEEACLNFHESPRAVSTPSSEQVRTPIFREGLDHWRHFEAWLDPLRGEVADLVEHYPEVPAFA